MFNKFPVVVHWQNAAKRPSGFVIGGVAMWEVMLKSLKCFSLIFCLSKEHPLLALEPGQLDGERAGVKDSRKKQHFTDLIDTSTNTWQLRLFFSN